MAGPFRVLFSFMLRQCSIKTKILVSFSAEDEETEEQFRLYLRHNEELQREKRKKRMSLEARLTNGGEERIRRLQGHFESLTDILNV